MLRKVDMLDTVNMVLDLMLEYLDENYTKSIADSTTNQYEAGYINYKNDHLYYVEADKNGFTTVENVTMGTIYPLGKNDYRDKIEVIMRVEQHKEVY